MPNYRRNLVPGGLFCISVARLERKRDLLVSRVDLVREMVRRARRLYPFDSVACVVLPDHVRCIWTLGDGDSDYPTRWRLINRHFAKGMPKHERW
jgi:putative transposase